MPWDVRRRSAGATNAGLELTPEPSATTKSAAERRANRQPVTAKGRLAKIHRLCSRVMRTESELQKTVLDLADLLYWKRSHFRAAKLDNGRWVTPFQGDAKGWPDLTLVRGRRLIFAELKSPSGAVEPEQQAWLDALRHVAEVYVWRPSDIWEILDVLQRETKRV